MAGILGLGSGQAAALNQDLLDKLKEADRTALVVPYETRIENITKEGGEAEKLAEITSKANELLEAVKPFYQFVSGGVTVFDLKTANTTGSSAVFDTSNESLLKTGTTSVHINQLATRDVYQSSSFNSATKASDLNTGTLTIKVAGADGLYSTSFDFDTTGKTYEELATEINSKSALNASIEQVGDDEYRLVIKSTQSGSANALQISQDFTNATSEVDFNFDSKAIAANSFVSTDLAPAGTITIDGTNFTLDGSQTYENLAALIDADSNFSASFDLNGKLNVSRVDGMPVSITNDDFGFGLTTNGGKTIAAQNMEAVVDGIAYSSSTNTITVDGGLKITAVKVDNENENSTINVENDTAYIGTYLQNFVDKYNEFIGLVDAEIYSSDSVVTDKSSLRTMMDGIKSKLFGSYGVKDNAQSNLNIFNFGIELDKSGVLSLDTDIFNDKVANNLDDLKALFFDGYTNDGNGNTATIKGLGTELKEYIDNLDGFDGILYSYQLNMDNRKTSLEEEKTKAEDSLNSKYAQLALQFSAYSSIISQMDSAFSGLKMLIEQSTASSS